MERGLYIAATGMLGDIARQDTIASNLANVNTVGYKSDRVLNETFSDLFLQNMRNGAPVGSMTLGTNVSSVVTVFGQGPMRNTGEPLHAALAGDGFFTVQNPQGEIRYTRNGQFDRTTDGYLVTQNGEYVLNSQNQRILIGSGDPTIASDGRVYNAGGALLGQLGIVTADVSQMRKIGGNLWAPTGTINPQPAAAAVRQGFLEQSDVNSVKEMISMITTLRSYESSQKVMTAIDGTLDKAVNSVGVVS